ncbi:carbohydrate-binding module family 14 protein [Sulfitobacter sp.]|jgi:hypothetical protein|uniref:carbohydrate-binding module family 14 protein n=1 Tax=Sulfitobacter sp. TaxID=1903071 RepID=UPI00356524CA
MKLAFTLSTLALVVLPTFGFATCSSQEHAMSCAEGTVYDAETATCVTAATS